MENKFKLYSENKYIEPIPLPKIRTTVILQNTRKTTEIVEDEIRKIFREHIEEIRKASEGRNFSGKAAKAGDIVATGEQLSSYAKTLGIKGIKGKVAIAEAILTKYEEYKADLNKSDDEEEINVDIGDEDSSGYNTDFD